MLKQNYYQRIKRIKRITPSEVRIAEYFEGNYPLIALENLTSISRKTHVSKATVVRFISRLGYKNFAEFRKALKKDLVFLLETPTTRYQLKSKALAKKKRDMIVGYFSYITQKMKESYSRISLLVAESENPTLMPSFSAHC